MMVIGYFYGKISTMKLGFFWALFAVFVCLGDYAVAQQKNIVIDSVRYNGGVNWTEEPCIAMDFKNPNKLLVVSNPPFGTVGTPPGYIFTSSDGGNTWKADTGSFAATDNGDPVTLVDTNGLFFYLHMAGTDNKLEFDRLKNFTPVTWSNSVYIGLDTPHMVDKPWAVVDRTNNEIYLTWSHYDVFGGAIAGDSTYIMFSKSVDTGNTWSTPLRISKMAGDCTNFSTSVEGGMPCAGPHGEIYVAWAHDGAILFNRSFDGGATWLNIETEVSNEPGGWYYGDIAGIFRSPGLPFIACDNSHGAYRGDIYINWSDQRNGVGNTDIWVSRSSDSGRTWKAPVKVNDDAGAAEQFMSSMTVDPVTGHIYVLFYDRRNYVAADSATDVYMAVSKDGGATFKNFKISEKPFLPQKKIFFGDYTCVSAYNNIVRPVWATMQSIATYESDSKIMTAIIDSTITGGVGVTRVDPLSYNLQAYPNPFTEQAYISYELPAAEPISLFVTDIMGRRITTIRENEWEQGGKHTDQFNADAALPPGVYFLCMRSPDFSQTIKMVKQ